MARPWMTVSMVDPLSTYLKRAFWNFKSRVSPLIWQRARQEAVRSTLLLDAAVTRFTAHRSFTIETTTWPRTPDSAATLSIPILFLRDANPVSVLADRS